MIQSKIHDNLKKFKMMLTVIIDVNMRITQIVMKMFVLIAITTIHMETTITIMMMMMLMMMMIL